MIREIENTGYNQRGGICRGLQPACSCSPLHRRRGGGGQREGDGGQHREAGGERRHGAQRGRQRGRAQQAQLPELHPSAQPAASNIKISDSSSYQMTTMFVVVFSSSMFDQIFSGYSQLPTRPAIPGTSAAPRCPC